MQAERFADAQPVVNVLLMVIVLGLVAAVLVFRGPVEQFLNRRTRRQVRADPAPAAGVLWVDDRPEHNARLLNGLREQGVPVDVAGTTNEALAHLGTRKYAIVVSDMSRVEDGESVVDAGRRLLAKAGDSIPVVIFNRYPSAPASHQDGEVTVVSSEAEIKEWLRTVNLLP
jgi:CheY-like chemotaxis protein